jgi:hypothetical protein
MATATIKILAEQTTDELTSLKALATGNLRGLDHSLCGWVSMTADDRQQKRAMEGSRRGMIAFLHAIDDELSGRGA